MIKYVANEPSVGLFYIQQHTQNAVANVLKLRKNVVEKSHETTLHTEDLEDSITMVRSMKECGFTIAQEMIGDIKKSLLSLSAKQPKRGLVHWPVSDFQTESTSFLAQDSYFSTVLQSAKEKARSFKWPQLDTMGSTESVDGKQQSYPNPPSSASSASTALDMPDMETDELLLSSKVEDGSQHPDISELSDKLLSVLRSTMTSELIKKPN
ncbi:hypothetical protein L6164_005842 [Bauhinia variegata]|nr:hypothetical protein L6164_005842 [Bauhinia variegata]